MNKSTKTYIKRLVFLMFVLAWMTTVFMFSNEPATTSQNTSLSTTERLVETFAGSEITPEEKHEIVINLDPIVRKLAHFTLYALGGFLIANFVNTYNIADKRKILYSICLGAAYACSDEIHQLFVEGRGGLISDVFIDSFGVATGVCCFLCVRKIIHILERNYIKKK